MKTADQYRTRNELVDELLTLRRKVSRLEKLTARHKELQLDIKTSELWLDNIFHSLGDSVLVVTPDRRLVNVNEATERMFGYTTEELSKHSTSILHVDKEHFEEFGQIIQSAFDRGEAASFQYRLKRKNGEVFPTEHYVRLLKEGDKPVGILSVVRDITKTKASENSYKNAEYMFRTLYELSQHTFQDRTEIADYVLEKIVEITSSRIGFLGFLNEDESVFVIHSWSKNAMKECKVIDKPIHFQIDKAGIWAEAVRQRKDIVINDYSAPDSLKKGLPGGHAALNRLLCTPVFDGGKITVVAAIGNRDSDYTENELRQVQILSKGMWNIVKSQAVQQRIEDYARRVGLLWELSQKKDIREKELTAQAIETVVTLTGSKVGYIHFFDENSQSIILNTWSKKTLENCSAAQTGHYPVASAGIWADAVRLRAPVVHNDYPDEPAKKGCPEGHFPILRHMSVPVIDNGKIVAIAGVGNKDDKYFKDDIEQLSQFMNNFWIIIKNRRTEQEVVRSLREKEVLLKEVHHRVKNNMAVISSLLSLQAGYIEDEKYLQMFKESKNRILSMALIHEKLYQSGDFAQIDVSDYVHSLTDNIHKTLTGSRPVKISVSVDNNLDIDIDSLVPSGLIINELLTNSIKHAFSVHENPEIFLRLKYSGENLVTLTVTDNGSGLPGDFDTANAAGLGLKLVKGLVSQLKGTMEITRDNGTGFSITFPGKLEFAGRG